MTEAPASKATPQSALDRLAKLNARFLALMEDSPGHLPTYPNWNEMREFHRAFQDLIAAGFRGFDFTNAHAVHIGILRGDIKLTRDQALHIAGATDYDHLKKEGTFEEGRRKGLEEAASKFHGLMKYTGNQVAEFIRTLAAKPEGRDGGVRGEE